MHAYIEMSRGYLQWILWVLLCVLKLLWVLLLIFKYISVCVYAHISVCMWHHMYTGAHRGQ